MGQGTVCVLDASLGDIELIRPPSKKFSSDTKSTIFNALNWTGFKPRRGHGIVNWEASPALFWRRGGQDGSMMFVSNIGSQAASMNAISAEYARWVKRTMGWVRRRGTKVWLWTREGGQSDYDVAVSGANAIYALPGAFEALQHGGCARESPEQAERLRPKA